MSAFWKTDVEYGSLLAPADFIINRHGQVTDAQRQRLNSQVSWIQPGLVVMMASLVVASLFSMPLLALTPSGSFSPSLLLVPAGIFAVVVLMMAGSMLNVWQMAAKLRRDFDNQAVRQAQGQLSFGTKQYVFQVGERRLLIPGQGTHGLLPGPQYRVCYLEESGFVLSAEETVPANPAQVRAALGTILAAANAFQLDDLNDNRSGRTTASQRRKLLPKMTMMAVTFALIAILLVLPTIPAASPAGNGGEISSLFLPGLILAVILLFGGLALANSLLDLLSSTPKQVEGTAHKEKRITRGEHSSTHYYYVIGKQRFEVTQEAFTVLLDGLNYRIYYLPRTKRLISIEPL